MPTRAVAYCRVSTVTQTTENQVRVIEDYCERQGWRLGHIYKDEGISGAKDRRPDLDRLKANCRKGRFDVVVVWKFDRMARSTSHLLETLALLQQHGVDFVSVTEAIDTTTPAGRMVLTFLGAIAEFEREIIRERILAGLGRAKANGTKLGRPRVGFDIQRAIALRRDGLGYKQIARQLGIPRTTLYRYLRGIDA